MHLMGVMQRISDCEMCELEIMDEVAHTIRIIEAELGRDENLDYRYTVPMPPRPSDN
jgi:hypothetical protein